MEVGWCRFNFLLVDNKALFVAKARSGLTAG